MPCGSHRAVTPPRPDEALTATGPSSSVDAAATLTVDLAALTENWRRLRDLSNPAECAAVVKADAYGVGLEQAGRALSAAGCRTFFVALLSEAARLRAAVPEATIYVLNGLLPGAAPRFAELDVRPILGSLPEVEDWIAAHGDRSAALHVDTGMNRLGLAPAEAAALAEQGLFRPALLMSHLVSAETPDDPDNRRQIEAFAAARRLFPDSPASLANSSGIFLGPDARHDLVRPGYALYGGNPAPGTTNAMRPVVTLSARIVQVRAVEPGETVGYNAQWTARRPCRLATLSIGYADGFPRAASATDRARDDGRPVGAALIAGRLCPFAGRVSMDLIVVDVTDVPEGEVSRGEQATLIGGSLDIDEVARRAGTIGYEVLTGLGRRYSRRYIEP